MAVSSIRAEMPIQGIFVKGGNVDSPEATLYISSSQSPLQAQGDPMCKSLLCDHLIKIPRILEISIFPEECLKGLENTHVQRL
jgi:hypothetical protein